MLTRNIVSELINYDPETGIITWKSRTHDMFSSDSRYPVESNCARWNTNYAGTVAGSLTKNGYLIISVSKKRHYAHRLVYLLMTGDWPQTDIDHINGNKIDNRWVNLRLATRSQNNTNSGLRRDNTSGIKGVSWYPRYGKWEAKICIDGKPTRLGYFNTIEDAASARAEAAKKYYGKFARAN